MPRTDRHLSQPSDERAPSPAAVAALGLGPESGSWSRRAFFGRLGVLSWPLMPRPRQLSLGC